MTNIGLLIRKSARRGPRKGAFAFAAAVCLASSSVDLACGGDDVCAELEPYYGEFGQIIQQRSDTSIVACRQGDGTLKAAIVYRLPSEEECHSGLRSRCQAQCLLDFRPICLELSLHTLDPNWGPSENTAAYGRCAADCLRTDGGFAR